MQIDVVIPTFNRLWALRRVVPFYLDRREVRQVIVVDDCSEDGTAEWLRDAATRDDRVVYIRHDANRGASASRNTGSGAATGDLVFFADDDMVFDPVDGLATMVAELDRWEADIIAPVHTVPERQEPSALPLVAPRSPAHAFVIFDRLTLELRPAYRLARLSLPLSFPSPLACGIMLMRRAVLSRVRYDESLGTTGYRDETDFQLKALSAGYRLVVCARPVLVDLARTRDDGGCHASASAARYEWLAWRNNWRILVRHHGVIREGLGIRVPTVVLQACFVTKNAVGRLGRRYVGRALRRLGFLKAGSVRKGV